MSLAQIRTTRLSATIRFGVISLLAYVIIFFILVMGMYLFNFNSTHTKGYDLTRLEIDRQSLLLKTEQQQLAISESKSIINVKKRALNKAMVKSDTPIFMRLDSAVAKK